MPRLTYQGPEAVFRFRPCVPQTDQSTGGTASDTAAWKMLASCPDTSVLVSGTALAAGCWQCFHPRLAPCGSLFHVTGLPPKWTFPETGEECTSPSGTLILYVVGVEYAFERRQITVSADRGDRFVSTFVREETHSQPKSERTQRGGDGQDSSHGRLWKLCLLAIASLSVLVLGTAFVWVSMGSQKSAPALTHAIMRGTLMVTVTEQGTLESSRNTEIKCEIRGGYGGRGGRSTVIWVIQPGTVVQAGDELVRLDTQRIEETVSLGKTDLNNEIAKLAQAQADLEKAQVALDGYLEGRFRAKMQSLENQLAEDARNLLTAQTMFHSSESLFEKGYVTQLEVDAMGYTVQRAELERDVTKNEIDVQARLVRAMELETLNGQLTATKARVAGREAGVALEQGRLDLAWQHMSFASDVANKRQFDEVSRESNNLVEKTIDQAEASLLAGDHVASDLCLKLLSDRGIRDRRADALVRGLFGPADGRHRRGRGPADRRLRHQAARGDEESGLHRSCPAADRARHV